MKSSIVIILIHLVSLLGCSPPTESINNIFTIQKSIISNGIGYTLSILKNEFFLEDSLKMEFEEKKLTLLEKKFIFCCSFSVRHCCFERMDKKLRSLIDN